MQCHWISFLPLSDLNFFYLLWCPFSSSSMPYFHFFFFPQVLHICCSHHLEYSFPPVFAWLPPSRPPCLSSSVPSKRDLLNPLRKVVLLPETLSIYYTVTLCDTTYYNLNLSHLFVYLFIVWFYLQYVQLHMALQGFLTAVFSSLEECLAYSRHWGNHLLNE